MMTENLQSLLSTLVLLGLVYLLGIVAVKAIVGRTALLSLASMAFGFGWGLLTWTVFMASWAGINLNALSIICILLLLILASLVIQRIKKNDSTRKDYEFQTNTSLWEQRGNKIIWLAILLLLVTAMNLSIGLSYYTWDDIANWAIKGYGIALNGSILAGNNWGANGLSYPLNMSLSIAIFRIITGDFLPGSKLLFPLYLFFLTLGCYHHLVMRGVKPWITSLALLFFISTPLISQHATSGYANIPFTYFLILGMLFCIEGIEQNNKGVSLIGGGFLAFASWTRPEGIFLAIAIIIAVISSRYITRKGVIPFLHLIVPTMIIFISWMIFSRTYSTSYGQAYQLFHQAIQGIKAGQFPLVAFYVIFKFLAGQVLRYKDFGFLPILITLIFIISFRWKFIRNNLNLATLFFSSLYMIVALIGLHFMGAFTEENSLVFLYTWLSLEFTRLAMPLMLSLTLLGTFLLTASNLKSDHF